MSKKFELEFKKSELILIDKIIRNLALLSELDEIQKLCFVWSDVYCRNMFGFRIDDFEKHHKHIVFERKIKGLVV